MDCDRTRSEDADLPGSTVVDDDQRQAGRLLSRVIFIVIGRTRQTIGVTTNQEVAGSSPAGRANPLRGLATPGRLLRLLRLRLTQTESCGARHFFPRESQISEWRLAGEVRRLTNDWQFVARACVESRGDSPLRPAIVRTRTRPKNVTHPPVALDAVRFAGSALPSLVLGGYHVSVRSAHDGTAPVNGRVMVEEPTS